MKQQIVIITDNQDSINSYLKVGWKVISVTAQHVSVATSMSYFKEFGKFCFLLENQNPI